MGKQHVTTGIIWVLQAQSVQDSHDMTGFCAFSPPRDRALFSTFWGHFLTKLHTQHMTHQRCVINYTVNLERKLKEIRWRKIKTNLASRWKGVRLPRASGRSPDFPGSSPNFPGRFLATSLEVLSLWNLTAIQGFPGSFPDFPGSSPISKS